MYVGLVTGEKWRTNLIFYAYAQHLKISESSLLITEAHYTKLFTHYH